MTEVTGFGPRDWSSHPSYVDQGYKSTALRGPTKPLIPLKATLSELTGPVYGHDSLGALDADLTTNRWASASWSPGGYWTSADSRCRTR
jgi:protocatechuate 3,4-dioxygenase beta subunit